MVKITWHSHILISIHRIKTEYFDFQAVSNHFRIIIIVHSPFTDEQQSERKKKINNNNSNSRRILTESQFKKKKNEFRIHILNE